MGEPERGPITFDVDWVPPRSANSGITTKLWMPDWTLHNRTMPYVASAGPPAGAIPRTVL